MDYTKRIREYCKNNANSFIDISMVRNSVFSDIPYKTLLKIFNRLEEEGIVKTVSKGLYSVGNKKVSADMMLKAYTENGKGMVVGYTLFNRIGLTVYGEEVIRIYTNAIKSKQKQVEDFLLKKVELDFSDEIIDLISLLEILDVGFGIRGSDYVTYRNTIELLAETYTDESFSKVITAIRYKYSTILKLDELLDRKNISNSCLNIYQNKDTV